MSSGWVHVGRTHRGVVDPAPPPASWVQPGPGDTAEEPLREDPDGAEVLEGTASLFRADSGHFAGQFRAETSGDAYDVTGVPLHFGNENAGDPDWALYLVTLSRRGAGAPESCLAECTGGDAMVLRPHTDESAVEEPDSLATIARARSQCALDLAVEFTCETIITGANAEAWVARALPRVEDPGSVLVNVGRVKVHRGGVRCERVEGEWDSGGSEDGVEQHEDDFDGWF